MVDVCGRAAHCFIVEVAAPCFEIPVVPRLTPRESREDRTVMVSGCAEHALRAVVRLAEIAVESPFHSFCESAQGT
jgi:hypothetical protein